MTFPIPEDDVGEHISADGFDPHHDENDGRGEGKVEQNCRFRVTRFRHFCDQIWYNLYKSDHFVPVMAPRPSVNCMVSQCILARRIPGKVNNAPTVPHQRAMKNLSTNLEAGPLESKPKKTRLKFTRFYTISIRSGNENH